MWNFRTTCLLVASLFWLVSPDIRSASPYSPSWDDGYRAYQDAAPEYVEIEIQEVKKRQSGAAWFGSANRDIFIQGKVLRVFRTREGIQPGFLIPISYSRKLIAGQSIGVNPPPPEVGTTVPAFLKYDGGGVFVPAALHHSFTPLTKEQLADYDRQSLQSDLRMTAQPEETSPSLPEEEPAPENPPSTAAVDLVEVLETPTVPQETVIVDDSPVIVEVEEPIPQATPVASAVPPPDTNMPEPVQIEEESVSVPAPDPIIDNPEPLVVDAPPASQPSDTPAPSATPSPREGPRFTGFLDLNNESETAGSTPVASAGIPPVTSASPPVTVEGQDGNEEDVYILVDSEAPFVEEFTDAPAPAASSTPEVTDMLAPIVVEESPQPQPLLAENPPGQPEVIDVQLVEEEPITIMDDAPLVLEEKVPTDNLPPPSDPELSLDDAPAPIVEPIEPESVTSSASPVANDPVVVEPQITSSNPTRIEPEETEPMKRYAIIFKEVRNAEHAIDAREFEKAQTLLQSALTKINSLKEDHPDFQPFMVEYRRKTTERALDSVAESLQKAPKPFGDEDED